MKRSRGMRTTGLFALLVAIIIISTNLRSGGGAGALADIKNCYELVDSIVLSYEDESREPLELRSVFLAQTKQSFSPLKGELRPAKELKLGKMTKLGTLSYRSGKTELFSAPLYVDSEGYMYQIFAKYRYIRAGALSFLL